MPATRVQVAVGNTPDVLSGATADMALGLMLACARRLVENDAYCRAAGQWVGYVNMCARRPTPTIDIPPPTLTHFHSTAAAHISRPAAAIC